MASNKPFGKALREARERQGLSLVEAARTLRIRTDVLDAIEASDFAHMPPIGFTQNMVKAYARLVGLNTAEISQAYHAELEAYQRASGALDPDAAPRSSRGEAERSYRSESGRRMYTDRAETRASAGSGATATRSSSRSARGNRATTSGQPYNNFYGGNQDNAILSFIKEKWFILAGIVVVILLVFLLSNVVSCVTAAPQEEEVTVPITGVTDTTGTTTGQTTQTTTTTPEPVEQAPTSAKFTYAVSGGSAYVQVTQDGNIILDSDVSDSNSYDVTGKLTFMTNSPNSVKCTVDDEEITLKENEIGLYECTVDFAAILQAWQQEHPQAGTTSTTTGSTAAGSSTAGTTSAGTTGATTTETADTASSAGTTGTASGSTASSTGTTSGMASSDSSATSSGTTSGTGTTTVPVTTSN